MKTSPSYSVTTGVSTSGDVFLSSTSEIRRNASAHSSLHSLKGSFISRLSSKIPSPPMRPSFPTGDENIPSSSFSLTISEATSILAPSRSSVHLPVLSSVEGGGIVISTVSIVVTRTLAILPSITGSGTHTTDSNAERTTLYQSSITLGLDSSPPIDKSDKISKAVDAILPILLGSDDGSTANVVMDSKQKQRLEQRAALANLIRWLLSFFRIEVD